MSENAPVSEIREIELPRIRGEHFQLIYSNWVQAGRTPWDIALVFGQVQEVEPNKTAISEVATIVMTPQLAKALIATLATTIKDYERDNGEIPIPSSLKRLSEERTKRLSSSSSLSPSASASPSPEPPEED